MSQGTRKDDGSYGDYVGIGLQFAGAIVLFLFLGQWLDRKLGTAPWMLYLGVFVGAAASFYSMYRKLMAIQERDEAAKREARGPKGDAK